MENWKSLAVFVILVTLLMTILSAATKERNRKKRESERKLELVLQPKETVKVICPQKKGRCILTSKRLLFETGQGFTAISLKSIKRVQGNNEKGNRTTSIPKMVSLTVKAEKDYVIQNTNEAFAELAKQLTTKIEKQSQRKK